MIHLTATRVFIKITIINLSRVQCLGVRCIRGSFLKINSSCDLCAMIILQCEQPFANLDETPNSPRPQSIPANCTDSNGKPNFLSWCVNTRQLSITNHWPVNVDVPSIFGPFSHAIHNRSPGRCTQHLRSFRIVSFSSGKMFAHSESNLDFDSLPNKIAPFSCSYNIFFVYASTWDMGIQSLNQSANNPNDKQKQMPKNLSSSFGSVGWCSVRRWHPNGNRFS